MRLSIRSKLLIAFLGTIAIAYLIIVALFSKYETKILQQRAMHQLATQANYTAQRLKNWLESLQKETAFLGRLEIMDDIIANDIDKRIIQIVTKKKIDIGKNVDFIVFDTKENVVATTINHYNTDLFHQIFFQTHKRTKPFILGTNIIFPAKIVASFEPKRVIGTLVLLLPLQELKSLLPPSQHLLAWIVPPPNIRHALRKIFPAPQQQLLQKEYLYLYEQLSAPLQGWKLGYALHKDVAFETVRQVQHMLFLTFAVLLLLISALIFIIDRKIIQPIRKLSLFASKIVPTNNFTTPIPIPSKDEIGDLAKNFNQLMQKVAQALQAIEMQNQKTVQTLINLMDFFAQMLQSKTKEETIEHACEELQRLTKAKKVWYAPKEEDIKSRIILLQSHLHDKEYGIIHIQGAKEKIALEERFFEAAGRMISLQIDKIELLETTKEALKSKTYFFSALSHELRTPLGSILSISQFLMTSPQCDEKAKESLGKIESSASHLLQIINDILLLAKVESGKLEPNFIQCDIVSLCKQTVDMIVPLAEAKDLTIDFFTNKKEIFIKTDPKLCKQVLINLLSNSIKYTHKGSIQVQVFAKKDMVEIIVKDSGIGIEPEFLKNIFNEFHREYRVNNSNNGSGLGLALSKKIAKALHGDIFIESEGVNRGTKAIFQLFL